jgi:SAM-dependent methyltransferase
VNPFQYDFGYGFLWNYGHLLAVVPFGLLALVAWRLRWPRFAAVGALAVSLWGLVGLWIVQFPMRLNLPLKLPTERFLAAGGGRVLDGGAGSGRAALMVLEARLAATVVAVDLYEGYFGIEDNTPARLMANAEKAGVADRVEARVGDLRELPLEDASFDGAVSAFVIDHLSAEGIERSLAEIERVLKPGGQFLLMVINPDPWVRIAYPFFVHHGYFGGRTSHDLWRRRLEEAGLGVVESGTVPATLWILAERATSEEGDVLPGLERTAPQRFDADVGRIAALLSLR